MEEEESSDETKSFDEGSDDAKSEEKPPEEITGTSKDVKSSRGRGRKGITHK